MIYALLKNQAAHRDIVRAISEHDSRKLQSFVGKVIIHVIDATTTTGPFFCIYCQDQVSATNVRSPVGHKAQKPWHFQHKTNRKCIGEIGPLGVQNPRDHGCYVALGCETVKDRNRADCQTIDKAGHTYCHLARTLSPPCVT